MRKFSTAWLFLVVLLFNETIQSCLCSGSTFGCIEQERQALLKFKQSLTDTSRRLSSWNGEDCCNWEGVHCDGVSGHVVKLDLRSPVDITSGFVFFSRKLEATELNSSLLELKYLNHLDLSGNNFQRSPIPKFFGSMARLRYLNLSDANFGGRVPHHLGNLSSLRVLDLKYNDNLLTIDDLTWVSRLSSLQYLDLSAVNLSQAHNLKKVLINMLPSILELHLSMCGLDSIHLSDIYVNSTVSNIHHLDLSDNSCEGEFPSFLRNMTSLRVLDLSSNRFNSSVSLYLENLKSLEYLYIGYNELDHVEGGLLRFLLNHCSLKSLAMGGNRFHEEMSRPYGNLSGCTTHDLEVLWISGNEFPGHLPDWLGQFKHLKNLDLSGSLFGGAIPPSLGTLSSLRVLDLSENELNGTIPVSIGQLSNLKLLDISSNKLEGLVTEAHFANLSMLEDLIINYNSLFYYRPNSNFLTLKMRSDWIPPFQLSSILMASCKIGTQFPQWLQTQKKVVGLHLSNASISGALPERLHEMHLLEYLDLSQNHISGPIQKLPSTLREVHLSDNLISGPLPQNIGVMVPNLERLLLAGNEINGSIPHSLCEILTLQSLDLSKNRLSGNFPRCKGEQSMLEVMKLSSNKLSGVIPSSIGHFCASLEWLNLNNNSLYGELPLALRNCTLMKFLDLGDNGFSGNIPSWIGEKFDFLSVLRLHNNMFNDSIPSQLCHLDELRIMDLGANNLTGTIPLCFGNLTGMILDEYPREFGVLDQEQWLEESMKQVMKGLVLEYTTNLDLLVNMDLSRNNLVGTIPEELTVLYGLVGLNLSHNHLTGSIPKRIGDLKKLESLDFSGNQLSGTIPQSMTALTFISYLNLSYNNFSGQIPTGKQLQTLNDPSIYIGNSELCGAPLPRKCPGDESSQPPATTDQEEKYEGNESEKVWFYLVIMSGYATGLWGVLGVLLFKKSWRHAYFQFVDVVKEKIIVAIAVRVARLNK